MRIRVQMLYGTASYLGHFDICTHYYRNWNSTPDLRDEQTAGYVTSTTRLLRTFPTHRPTNQAACPRLAH